MSDHDDLDVGKRGRVPRATPARDTASGGGRGLSPGTDGATAGRPPLAGVSAAGDAGYDAGVSRTFFARSVSAARAEMGKLAAAIAAIDFHQAVVSASVLGDHLRTARVRVEHELAQDEGSIRTFAELEYDAEALLAKAPRPSADALASSAMWGQDAERWRAKCRGDHGPPSGSTSPARGTPEGEASPRAAGPAHVAAAEPSVPRDLGNYDSEVGKHVVVLRSWDNATIMARRVELQERLSRTLDLKARDKLLREYEAIQWVARERNLTFPKDPGEEAAPQAFMGGQPTKFWMPDTAQGTRAMLEREMAAATGYGAAKEHAQQRIGHSTTSGSPADNDKRLIAEQQTALMDHDAAAFSTSFRTEAKHTAVAMLDASSVAVDTVLRSYGIAGGSLRLSEAARKVAANPGSLDAEVETWVALSQRLDGNQAAHAAGHGNREELAKEAQQLRDLQDSIDALAGEQLRLIKLQQARHPQHPGMAPPPKQPDASKLESMVGKPSNSPTNPFDQLLKPAVAAPEGQLAFVQGALQLRRAQFRAAWINAERAHPVLAAYRAGKPPDTSTLEGIGTDDGTMRSVIKHVLPKLGNIVRTKAALMGAWGTLDPLRLAPVVELTKQRMFVAEGSYRDRIVHDLVEQAQATGGDVAHWAFEAVMIGLTLLSLVPTGGTSAMTGLALTGLAYDLYAGLGESEDFKLATAASDTDLDKVRSLSDTEPSLTPLLMRMVSAGLNFAIAASLFKRAVGLRRMAAGSVAEREARAALNKAGEAVGVKGIGDEAMAEPGASTQTNTHGTGGGGGPEPHPVQDSDLASAVEKVPPEKAPTEKSSDARRPKPTSEHRLAEVTGDQDAVAAREAAVIRELLGARAMEKLSKQLKLYEIEDLVRRVGASEAVRIAGSLEGSALRARYSEAALGRMREEAADLRTALFPGKAVGRKNIAVAEAHLDDGAHMSTSSTSGPQGKAPRPKPASQGGQFEPSKDPSSGRVMDTDPEYKTLSQLGDWIEKQYPDGAHPTGKVYLYTEMEMCASCASIKAQFEVKFPGIRVDVVADYPYPFPK